MSLAISVKLAIMVSDSGKVWLRYEDALQFESYVFMERFVAIFEYLVGSDGSNACDNACEPGKACAAMCRQSVRLCRQEFDAWMESDGILADIISKMTTMFSFEETEEVIMFIRGILKEYNHIKFVK